MKQRNIHINLLSPKSAKPSHDNWFGFLVERAGKNTQTGHVDILLKKHKPTGYLNRKRL